MLDVHFDNQVLHLASVNCEAHILLKTVLQRSAAEKLQTLLPESHQYFACILINEALQESRLIEDFEVIHDLDGEKFHLEIKECPFKYEMFRRPGLIFQSEFSSVHSKEYSSKTHETLIEESLRFNKHELRLRARLKYALRPHAAFKKADFLLKRDPKLGGVLMYSANAQKANFPACQDSQIGYFVFVILSECDIHFRLSKKTKNPTFQILFKTKASMSRYEYLSINKDQAPKSIAFDSRSDFVAWFSALRLAKHGWDNLNQAYKNIQVPLRQKSNGSLTEAAATVKSRPSFKSKVLVDLQRVKGLDQFLKLKTKARVQSLSWSESISALSSNTSSATQSQLSIGSSSDSSSSSMTTIKEPRQVCAMLSNVPYEETAFEEPFTEESDLVPIDMSGKGCEIVTDPEIIRQIQEESAFKSRFRSIKSLPLEERWFTRRSSSEIEQYLLNYCHMDGYFLVTPEYGENCVALSLNVMFSETLHRFKILQHQILGKVVFSLEGGSFNFPTISALVDFHSLNIMKPIPCYLTDSPLVY